MSSCVYYFVSNLEFAREVTILIELIKVVYIPEEISIDKKFMIDVVWNTFFVYSLKNWVLVVPDLQLVSCENVFIHGDFNRHSLFVIY